LQQETSTQYQQNSSKPIAAISLLAYCYQLFAASVPLKFVSRMFWLKLVKLFFCDLKSISLNLKIKYQQFNVKGRSFNLYNF
jgi:hypothetical protein